MKKQTHGYALIAVMFAVLLCFAMISITVALSTSENGQSGGNQTVARVRAAAEAGQADAIYYMANQGLSDVNTVLDPYAASFSFSNGDATSKAIIPAGQYATILTALNGKGGMNITGTANGVAYSATINYTGMDVDERSFNVQGQDYVLDYTVAATGSVASYTRTVSTRGQLQVHMGRKFINSYVLLANDAGASSGNFFATGMDYDGPVHINGNWKFAGKPSFKYGASTAASNVGMYNCSKNGYQNVNSQSNDCTQPDWGGYGLKYNADSINLPQNALSQQNAALGLDPNSTSAPTNSQECLALGNAAPITCSAAAVPNGVYVPYNAANQVTGGIYIKGDAKSMVMSVSGDKQIYTITDANGIIVTITVDYTAGTTTVAKYNPVLKTGTSVVLTGVLTDDPRGTSKANGMIYSTGSIKSLSGPARKSPVTSPVPVIPDPTKVPPAVSAKSVINIAAASDITVQGDVTYEQDPRNVPNAKNVLGLMAGSGSVHIGTSAPDNVYVQAALLAGKSNQGFAVDNYNSGAPRGQINLLGSVAEDGDPPRGIGSADGTTIYNGYGDAFHFDPRFLNGGSVPPYYPATKKFTAQAVWPNQQGWREQ